MVLEEGVGLFGGVLQELVLGRLVEQRLPSLP
jgi:hypothetical protein